MKDLIDRYNAIDAMCDNCDTKTAECAHYPCYRYAALEKLASEQVSLCGYSIEYLILIATLLQKENLPPDRVGEAIADIGGIVSIVRAEFENEIQKTIERWLIEWEKR